MLTLSRTVVEATELDGVIYLWGDGTTWCWEEDHNEWDYSDMSDDYARLDLSNPYHLAQVPASVLDDILDNYGTDLSSIPSQWSQWENIS